MEYKYEGKFFIFINIKGSFQNGHKHGEGKETYKNGTVYEG